MRHALPGSVSVVSRVMFGKMETIDRMWLIHCGKTPGFGCGRIRKAVSSDKSVRLRFFFRCSTLEGRGKAGLNDSRKDPQRRLTGFTGNRLFGTFRAEDRISTVCRWQDACWNI